MERAYEAVALTLHHAMSGLERTARVLLITAAMLCPGVLVAGAGDVPHAEAAPAAAAEHEGDISGALLHHVSDGSEWEIIPGLAPLHLPWGITVHMLMVWLTVALIGGVFIVAARRQRMRTAGLPNALEMLILFVRDDIVYPIMGEKRGEKWLPFFITLFVFLAVSNYIGLIPLFRTPTGNFNVTSALAVMILVILIGAGMIHLGVLDFFKNMYPEGAPAPIGLLVLLLEVIGLFIKTLVLSLRLFANMVAGHLVILSLLSMIFILSPWFCSISVPLAVCVYVLELLVALIQAVVFTLLSCIFISMASSAH